MVGRRRRRAPHVRKKVGKGTFLNMSRSGVSVSKSVGPITVNSRGKVSFNLKKLFKF